MKYKGIIFDLDGVLCQTDEYHYQAWKQLADRLQIPFDREQNNSLRGVSRMESLNIILANGIRQYSEAEKKMFAAEKNDLYCKQLARMTPDDMPDDVKETLIALRCSGYKLAVGSSSKNAPTIINHLGIASFFDAIVDGNSIVVVIADCAKNRFCSSTIGAVIKSIEQDCTVIIPVIHGFIETDHLPVDCIIVAGKYLVFLLPVIHSKQKSG